jgi:hypothetical protein
VVACDGFPWSVNETIPGLRALSSEKNYNKVFLRSSPHLGYEENFFGALLACICEGTWTAASLMGS